MKRDMEAAFTLDSMSEERCGRGIPASAREIGWLAEELIRRKPLPGADFVSI